MSEKHSFSIDFKFYKRNFDFFLFSPSVIINYVISLYFLSLFFFFLCFIPSRSIRPVKLKRKDDLRKFS